MHQRPASWSSGERVVTLIVNGEPHESSGSTMGELLQDAVRHVGKGEVISRVAVDGIEMPGFMAEAFLASVPGDASEVVIESTQPKNVMLSGLEHERRFFVALRKELPAMASKFRSAEPLGGVDKMGVMAEGLKTLLQLLQAVASFYPKLNTVFREEGEDLQAHLVRLAGVVELMTTSQNSADWDRLADTLEHQMSEEAKRWIEVLTRLQDELRASEEL